MKKYKKILIEELYESYNYKKVYKYKKGLLYKQNFNYKIINKK
jgi:hypothetical protein